MSAALLTARPLCYARATVAPSNDFLFVILAGPSGSGKTTIARRLLDADPKLVSSVSYTTRAPRHNETDGVHYHFTDRASFLAMVARGEFLEWAEVHGNLYGTHRPRIDEARARFHGLVFDIDYQGARQIRAHAPHDIVGIFLLPPSLAVLKDRLTGRGTDAPEVIDRRLKKALHEIEHYSLFDYLVVNDSLDRAYDEVRAVISAERARRSRRAIAAEALLRESLPD